MGGPIDFDWDILPELSLPLFVESEFFLDPNLLFAALN